MSLQFIIVFQMEKEGGQAVHPDRGQTYSVSNGEGYKHRSGLFYCIKCLLIEECKSRS